MTERWSPYFPAFKGAATPTEVRLNAPPMGVARAQRSAHVLHQIKAQIRHAIFQGLSDPSWKIRSLCVSPLEKR